MIAVFRESCTLFSGSTLGVSGVGIKKTDSLKFNGTNYSEPSFMFSSKLLNNSFKEQRPEYPVEKYIP